jgi:hypothetical protein
MEKNNMSNTMNDIEAGLNVAGAAGAAFGGVVGQAVNAALPVVENVVNAVVAQSPHQTALSDVANAVNTAAPIVATASAKLPANTAAQVASGMTALQALIAFLKTVF